MGVRLVCGHSEVPVVSRAGSLELTDVPLWPSLSQNMRVPVGIVLSLTLGHVEELESLGRKEGEVVFSWSAPLAVHFPSPLCIAGLQTRSSSKPSAAFSLLFPSQPSPQPRELMGFPLLVFQEEKSLNDVWSYQPREFQSTQEE